MNFIKSNKQYVHVVSTLPSSGREGELYLRTDDNTLWRWDSTGGGGSGAFVEVSPGALGLNDLNDVIITSATTGDILQFVGTEWVNVASGNLDSSTGDTTITVNNGTGATLKNVDIQVNKINKTHIDTTGETSGHVLKVDSSNGAHWVAESVPAQADLKSTTVDGKIDVTTTNGKVLNDDIDIKVANGAINTNQLANGAVTNNEIANNTIEAGKITGGTVGQILTSNGSGNAAEWKSMSGVFNYKNSIDNISDLPSSGNTVGDVYNIKNTNGNDDPLGKNFNVVYVGTGGDITSEWDHLGGTIDLTGYYTKTEADNKFVEIKSGHNILYGRDGSGNEIVYNIGTGNGNIPQRDNGGQIEVPATPTADTDAASKKYVDDAITAVKTEKLGIDLRDNNILSIIAVEDCKLENEIKVRGTGTPTSGLLVNSSAYTLGDPISANAEITWNASVNDSVWSYDYTKL